MRWWFSRCENQRRAERRNSPATGDAPSTAAARWTRAQFSQRENCHLSGGFHGAVGDGDGAFIAVARTAVGADGAISAAARTSVASAGAVGTAARGSVASAGDASAADGGSIRGRHGPSGVQTFRR